MATALVAMSIAWLLALSADGGRSGPSSFSLPRAFMAGLAPAGERIRCGWLLGSTAAVAVLATAFVPLQWIAGSPPPSTAVAVVEFGLAWAAATSIALVVTLLADLLPRPVVIAASGTWLFLSAGAASAGSASSNWLARLATSPLFPLSRALVRAEETAQLGSSLRALGSVALLDVGLFVLLVAFETRPAR